MTQEEIDKLKAPKADDEPPRHFVARDRIRRILDPEEKLIKDEVIYRILLMSGGNVRRAMHKCILQIQQDAKRERNTDMIVWARNKLALHESGLLLKDGR